MEIVSYRPEHFDVLVEWFNQWGWTPCDKDCIPKNAYFVMNEGKLVAFSCFLATDCSVAIMGFTICDKESKGRTKAVDFLIKTILHKSKEQGYKYLHYYTDSEVMVDRMEKQGFLVTDRATAYILIGDLGGGNINFFDE